MSRAFSVLTAVMLMGVVVATQRQFPPGYLDPAPILTAARQAIGTDNLRCVTIAGTAYAGALGQARESARNTDWPRIDSLANYTRTMNWENWSMKEEFDRKPGLSPAGWKYGIGWEDGPLQKNLHQTFMLNGTHAWYMDGAGSPAVALSPDVAEIFPGRARAESTWLPQSGRTSRRESEGRLALGARRDGTRRTRGVARAHARRVDHVGQVSRRCHHQQGEPAPADSHLGAERDARRHELRARVHQRQLRESRATASGSPRAGIHIRGGTTTSARRP